MPDSSNIGLNFEYLKNKLAKTVLNVSNVSLLANFLAGPLRKTLPPSGQLALPTIGGTEYVLKTISLDSTMEPFYVLDVKNQVSHLYKTTGKLLLYSPILIFKNGGTPVGYSWPTDPLLSGDSENSGR